MYRNIFDSHAHYTDNAFDTDRESMLGSLKESGVCGVINCATDILSSISSLELASQYDFIFAACGIHPENVDCIREDYLQSLKQLAENPKCVAIGEIGLDYHWRQDNKQLQKEIFESQISLSNELSLPVIVHDRDAHGDTLEILKKHKPRGVLHCFSGSVETAAEILKLGMYIGFGGALTFKNARRSVDVAQFLPLERILLETDCPYMAPVPMRGKRNNSAYITFVAEKLAEIKGVSAQEILTATRKNAENLFKL